MNVLVTYIIKHAGLVKANKQIINEGNTLTHCVTLKRFLFLAHLGECMVTFFFFLGYMNGKICEIMQS